MKKILKQQKRKREYEPLPCDKETAYFLCLLGGWAGAHKFYDAIGYSEVKGFKKYL